MKDLIEQCEAMHKELVNTSQVESPTEDLITAMHGAMELIEKNLDKLNKKERNSVEKLFIVKRDMLDLLSKCLVQYEKDGMVLAFLHRTASDSFSETVTLLSVYKRVITKRGEKA